VDPQHRILGVAPDTHLSSSKLTRG
jgi:hypothetical protein